MAAMKHFDTLAFVKKSKELGVKEEIAEYQARQIESAIDIAVYTANDEFKALELATKNDLKQVESCLKQDIKQLETDLKQDIKQVENNIKQLELKIEQYRYDSLKFIVWTGVGAIIFLSGLLAKGFHWL